MKPFLLKLAGRASELAQTQPVIAFFLGGALLSLFFFVWLRGANNTRTPPQSLPLILYNHAARLLWALLMVLLVASALSVLRTYLRQAVAHFQHAHGRITQANYNAVQTIWGSEQVQRELSLQLYYDEEITERIEPEDLTKPAVLRKKTVRHNIPGNPFISARHEVTLQQNPRKKGSALYGGYETLCRFTWKLKSPADRETKGLFRFPLPGEDAILDDLTAVVNGQDVLSRVELSGSAITLARDFSAGEQLDVSITFKSRGVAFWYFQVQERREIRDFTLTLNLPSLPRSKLNYPEGCMLPTEIKPTADNNGSMLTYRLDHAISHKGMGISLPEIPQPGATTNAVLGEAERGWMLIAALLLLGMTLSNVPHAPLASMLLLSAVAFSYGLLADLSDLIWGFWGTAGLVFTPLILAIAWLAQHVTRAPFARWIAGLVLLFGLIYPVVAGLDSSRNALYLNLCALVLLIFAGWQLADELRPLPAEPGGNTQPAQ